MIFKLKNSYYQWIVTILVGIGWFLVGIYSSYAARINASINEGFIPVGSCSGSSGTNSMYFSSPDRWIDGGKKLRME